MNSSSGFTAPTIGSNTTATSTARDNVFTFTLPSAGASLTKINSFDLTVTVTVSGTTTSLTATTITAVVDLAPVAAAYSTASGSGGFPTSTTYPRFAAAPTASFTVVSIIAARTNLLVPYLVADGTFDTGIVIANTTADPWSGIGGGTPLGRYPHIPLLSSDQYRCRDHVLSDNRQYCDAGCWIVNYRCVGCRGYALGAVVGTLECGEPKRNVYGIRLHRDELPAGARYLVRQ